MDYLIFIDVTNPNVDEGHAWTIEQKKAVIKALSEYQFKVFGKVDGNLKEYANKKCIGCVFETMFSFHSYDRLIGETTIDEVYSHSKIFYQAIKATCLEHGLLVSYHSSV